jgi:putrescine transport system substrate-binding protein
LAIASTPALSETALPFAPPAAPKAKNVRLLAYPEYFDPHVLEDYERETGWAVAYDSYETPDALAEKWREGPYDLVVLPGPALARRIASGAFVKLDKSKVPAAKSVQPAVAAKLAAYDPGGVYAVAFGWSAIGLLYDADKAAQRLGGAPASWTNALLPQGIAKMADCGVAIPDIRDALFDAAFLLMGVEPARATPVDAKGATFVIVHAAAAAQSLGVPDIVGALARGGDCLSVGTPGEAEAADARGRQFSDARIIRFIEPREGGPMSIDAFAIPRDAPHPDQAYALLQFLLRADTASADARVAGVTGAEVPGQDEILKRLRPEGVFDPRVATAIEAEWARLRAPPPPSEPAQHAVKPTAKAAEHPRRHGRSAGAVVSAVPRPQSRQGASH